MVLTALGDVVISPSSIEHGFLLAWLFVPTKLKSPSVNLWAGSEAEDGGVARGLCYAECLRCPWKRARGHVLLTRIVLKEGLCLPTRARVLHRWAH